MDPRAARLLAVVATLLVGAAVYRGDARSCGYNRGGCRSGVRLRRHRKHRKPRTCHAPAGFAVTKKGHPGLATEPRNSPRFRVRGGSHADGMSKSNIDSAEFKKETETGIEKEFAKMRITAGPCKSRSSTRNVTLESIVNLCKRRGFVFPSAEIYGGLAGFFDYGPLGTEMRRRIRDLWWRRFVQARKDIVGIESSAVSPMGLFKASGHLDTFSDPIASCKYTKERYRADQVYFVEAEIHSKGKIVSRVLVSAAESQDINVEMVKAARKLASSLKGVNITLHKIRKLTEATREELQKIYSPGCSKPGGFDEINAFNLMFQTQVGATSPPPVASSSTPLPANTAFLRPETAQGIFSNFKTVESTMGLTIPFGIAQIGKAYRNEISPRNFIFRTREFEQMEIEYFVHPDSNWREVQSRWLSDYYLWLISIGVSPELMGYEIHKQEDLAHYATACTDITFQYPFGSQELMGVAVRGSYDLQAHQKCSGKSMALFNETSKSSYIPHVIEPSAGLDRIMLAALVSAYDEDVINERPRVVLRLRPSIAPYFVGIFPLTKDVKLIELAESIREKLFTRYNVFYDVAGAIGRRYRRMDEVGTPYCITVDALSLNDSSVTIRDRDTCAQERVPIALLSNYLDDRFKNDSLEI